MNVTITNINQDTLKAIETLLKPFIKSNNMQIIKSDNSINEAIKEAEDMLQSGDFKVYTGLEEYKRALGV